MTIYLDIVLLENIILNYIIILSTAIISKSRISFIRIMLSSTIGGIFAILNYIVNMNIVSSVLLKVVISILMMLIAFKDYRIKKVIRQLIFFYLVSFTFGGIAFMLLFFIKPPYTIKKFDRITILSNYEHLFKISILLSYSINYYSNIRPLLKKSLLNNYSHLLVNLLLFTTFSYQY